MAYPRCCPLCSTSYQRGEMSTDRLHVTVQSEPGGTPSPWRPRQPGRLLTLLCLTCGGRFPWDYFADARRANGTPVADSDMAPVVLRSLGGLRRF